MHAYGVCVNLCIHLLLVSPAGTGLETGDKIFILVSDRTTSMHVDVVGLNLELIAVITLDRASVSIRAGFMRIPWHGLSSEVWEGDGMVYYLKSGKKVGAGWG